jgi:hypothetical protein
MARLRQATAAEEIRIMRAFSALGAISLQLNPRSRVEVSEWPERVPSGGGQLMSLGMKEKETHIQKIESGLGKAQIKHTEASCGAADPSLFSGEHAGTDAAVKWQF